MATVSYSAYLELAHKRLLDHEGVDTPAMSLIDALNSCFSQSPYTSWIQEDVQGLFFGSNTITSYPSLFDMFGQFMAGVDPEALWLTVLNNTTDNTIVDGLVSNHSVYLQDEIDITIMPKLMGGLRDINSVMSSTLLIAKTIVQETKLKAVAKFSAEMKYELLKIAKERWSDTLTWNKQVIAMYGEYAKLYLSAYMDHETMVMDFHVKDKLWNLKLFEYSRAMLGAIQGSPTTPGLNEPSQFQKTISGAMSGASVGASIGAQSGSQYGGGWGAAIGAVVGAAASFAK